MMRRLTQVALATVVTTEVVNRNLSTDISSGDGSDGHMLLQHQQPTRQQPRYDVGIYENALNITQFLADLNFTTNDTELEGEKMPMDPWNKWCTLMQDRALVVSLLLIFSLTTVFGNMLVILAVIRERCLHTATNYFITSLAVADCLVGFVVMPISAMYEVLEHTWFFGADLCDVWRSLDVLFSTASILNLCVISLDRYWAITDPMSYPMRMTRSKSGVLIATVWICSSGISFPAIAWWRAVRRMPIPPYKCPFTENLGYLVFSSTISFYLPLFVMVFTYFRIYKAAVEQTKSLRLGTKQVLLGAGNLELTLRIHRGGTCKLPNNSAGGFNEDEPLTALQNNGLVNNRMGAHSKNFSLSRKLAKFAKEKKAAKTLGIVMGVFICCWLPFFVVNLLSGFCDDCIWNEQMVLAIVTWLGWINSSMNPVIYALWSKDFRRAFLRILCVCCPRRIRNKYQPAYRNKPSQRFSSKRYYSSYTLRHNSCEQTYI